MMVSSLVIVIVSSTFLSDAITGTFIANPACVELSLLVINGLPIPKNSLFARKQSETVFIFFVWLFHPQIHIFTLFQIHLVKIGVDRSFWKIFHPIEVYLRCISKPKVPQLGDLSLKKLGMHEFITQFQDFRFLGVDCLIRRWKYEGGPDMTGESHGVGFFGECL